MDQKTGDLVASALQPLPNLFTILDLALLLFVLFFLLSTLASHILEAFVGLINSRGNQLYRRLQAALGEKVTDEIYDNPLIKSLTSDGRGASSALLQMLYRRLGRLKLTPDVFRGDLPAYVEPEFFARAVVVVYGDGTTQASGNPLFQQLKREAGDDVAAFRDKVVEWYKALNDRQNGTYTRWSFWRLLLIGAPLAASLDIDTVHIVGSLWSHPELAAKLVGELQSALPSAGAGVGAEVGTPDGQASRELAEAVAKTWRDIAAEATRPPLYAWQGRPPGAGDWLAKVVGWLLAAFATSLGAQFWFNLLGETLKLRAAGPKPADDTGGSTPAGGTGGGTPDDGTGGAAPTAG